MVAISGAKRGKMNGRMDGLVEPASDGGAANMEHHRVGWVEWNQRVMATEMCHSCGGKGVGLDVHLGSEVECFRITVLMTFDMDDGW